MAVVDEAVKGQLVREIVRAFRERGDLLRRSVVVDLEELAERLDVPLAEVLLGLAALVEDGVIDVGSAAPTLSLERAAASALARLDLAYLSGRLDQARYRRLVDAVYRVAGLGGPAYVDEVPGPLVRLDFMRVARLAEEARGYVCARARVLAELRGRAPSNPMLRRALALELDVLAGRVRAVTGSRLAGEALAHEPAAPDERTRRAVEEARRGLSWLRRVEELLAGGGEGALEELLRLCGGGGGEGAG